MTVFGNTLIPTQPKTRDFLSLSIFSRPSLRVCLFSPGPPKIMKWAAGTFSLAAALLVFSTSVKVKFFRKPSKVLSDDASVPNSIAASPDCFIYAILFLDKLRGWKNAHHGVLLPLLILCTGCMSKRKHLALAGAAYERGFNAADQACIKLQLKIRDVVVKMQSDLNAKNMRLRKFNQVDDQNNLLPVAPGYDAPKKFRPTPIKKSDTWMK